MYSVFALMVLSPLLSVCHSCSVAYLFIALLAVTLFLHLVAHFSKGS